MYYIYKLSFNQIVFYVGCSKRPFTRYAEHCRCYICGCTKNVIYPLIKDGVFPEMQIIAHATSRWETTILEKQVIKEFADKGHRLANRTDNPVYNQLNSVEISWRDVKTVKVPFEKIKHIKEHIDYYKSLNNLLS